MFSLRKNLSDHREYKRESFRLTHRSEAKSIEYLQKGQNVQKKEIKKNSIRRETIRNENSWFDLDLSITVLTNRSKKMQKNVKRCKNNRRLPRYEALYFGLALLPLRLGIEPRSPT